MSYKHKYKTLARAQKEDTEVLNQWMQQGWIEIVPAHYRLTSDGWSQLRNYGPSRDKAVKQASEHLSEDRVWTLINDIKDDCLEVLVD